MSFAIVTARHVMALRFISDRLGVGKQMILETVCVMLVTLFLVEMVNMMKYSTKGWVGLCNTQCRELTNDTC